MEFKDITTWSVSKGVATPVNPHEPATEPDYYRRKSEGISWGDFLRKQRTDFEDLSKQHTYATDAPPGIHSAEMFGEVEEQIYRDDIGGIWQTLLKYEITLGYEIRSFLPFKHPVEPNDKQSIGEYNELAEAFGKDIVDEFNKLGLPQVQPLNPNANAIKIIKKRIEFLKLCIGADMVSRISECIDILKLLQS